MEPVLPLAERVFSFLKNDFYFGFAQFTPGKASEKADSSPQACLCTKLWGKLAQMPTCPQKNQGPASCSLSWTAASHPGAQCFGRWKCLSQKEKTDLSTESAKPYYYYYLNSEYIENNWQKPRAAQNQGCATLSEVKKGSFALRIARLPFISSCFFGRNAFACNGRTGRAACREQLFWFSSLEGLAASACEQPCGQNLHKQRLVHRKSTRNKVVPVAVTPGTGCAAHAFQ